MDASYKIQRGIHVHLIQFFMCPEFWVHIKEHSVGLLTYTLKSKHVLTAVYGLTLPSATATWAGWVE